MSDRLKVSLKSKNSGAGCNQYHNEVNADNYKDVALVLLDLRYNGVPIEKAIKEFNLLIRSDFETIIGI